MSKYALLHGFILIVVGLVGYVATGRASATALIPAFLGILLAGLGALGLAKEELRKPLMMGALGLALVGFAGTVRALPEMAGLIRGGTVVEVSEDPVQAEAELEAARVRRWITGAKSVTALVTLAFMAHGVRSFVSGRKDL